MMENKTSTKNSSSSKKEKSTFADYRAEFKKIVWPTGAELRKQTITVIITSIIIAAVIFGLDSLYSAGQGLLINRITGGSVTIDNNTMDLMPSDSIVIDENSEDVVIDGADNAIEDAENVAGDVLEETPSDAAETEENSSQNE